MVRVEYFILNLLLTSLRHAPHSENGAHIERYELEMKSVEDLSWSRLFEHNGARRERFIVGLQRNHGYICRVRAYNAFGWSDWSLGSDVLRPGACVWLENEGGTAYLKWLEPKLTERRRVTLYHILSYELKGPLVTDHTVEDNNNEGKTSDQYKFLCAAENNYIIFEEFCRPNTRYVFKVRYQIDGEWTGDDATLLSEVIQLS